MKLYNILWYMGKIHKETPVKNVPIWVAKKQKALMLRSSHRTGKLIIKPND